MPLLGRGRFLHHCSFNEIHVQYVNLSRSTFEGIDCPLYGLDKLEVLDGSYCNIRTLPNGFMHNLPRIRVLYYLWRGITFQI